MEVPQKIKNITTIQSSNSTPGYLSKENKNTNSKRYIHRNVHSSIIYNSQDMEASVHQQMNGLRCGMYIYIYNIHAMEYYSTIKNENLPFATMCIDLEDIMSK